MVREDESPMAEKIGALFKAYLEKEREKNLPQVMALVKEEEARKRINERYEEAIEEAYRENVFSKSKALTIHQNCSLAIYFCVKNSAIKKPVFPLT